MHRTEAIGHDSNLFVDGNPAASPPVHPTYITADVCNAWQEELCNCIECTGATLNTATESGNDFYQLTDAIGQSWVTFTISGTTPTVLESRNLDTVAYNSSAGEFNISWDNDYDNDDYCITASVGLANTAIIHGITTVTAGGCRIELFNASGTAANFDARINVRATGTVNKP